MHSQEKELLYYLGICENTQVKDSPTLGEEEERLPEKIKIKKCDEVVREGIPSARSMER